MPHTLDKTSYLSALSRFLMLSQNICTNSYRNMVSLTQEEKPKMLGVVTGGSLSDYKDATEKVDRGCAQNSTELPAFNLLLVT